MNCEQAREVMSAYFDGELPVSRKSLAVGSDRSNDSVDLPAASAVPLTVGIHDHIAGCEVCARELRSFEQLRQLAASQKTRQLTSPSWESFAVRLVSTETLAAGSGNLSNDKTRDQVRTEPAASLVSRTRFRRIAIGGLLALAASALVVFSLRATQHYDEPSVTQAIATTINLQPLMELFGTDADQAIATLVSQLPTVDVPLAKVEATFGRPTFAQTFASKNSLPGKAQLVSTKMLQFPYCKCPKGACTCGPGGCTCVACLCERPDGSTYLVLELCKSQSITFGDLPVQLVKRGDRDLQQVEAKGTTAISWEQKGERLTAIGLRNDAEIETFLALR